MHVGGDMDPEITTLALTGASTLVGLMASDAWNVTKDRVTAIYRRFRPESHDRIQEELEESRSDLLATDEDHRNEVVEALRQEWQGRLRRFLAANPQAVEAMQEVLDELRPLLPNKTEHITMYGTARDGGRVYQQGQGTQKNY